jgi:hypothetical protein
MNNFKKYLSIALLTTTLAACGGGGGDKPSTGGGTTTPTDNAPTLTLNETDISIQENTSRVVSLTAADSDGDAITITAVESSDFISVVSTGNSITVTSTAVTADTSATVTVTAKANGKTATQTLTVLVTNVIEPVIEPVIVFADFEETVVITAESVFSYTLLLPEGAETFSISAAYDLEMVTVAFESEGMVLTPLQTATTEVVINIVDDLGNESATTLSVEMTFVDEFPDNTPPELNLSGANESNTVTVYANTNTEISVGLYDADGDDVVWQVSSLKLQGFDEEDLHLFLDTYLYDTENNKIQLKLKNLPLNETVVWFDLKMAYTDGTETLTKDYVLAMVLAPNGAPIIKFEGAVNGVIPVQVGSTRTFKYKIIDDEPEKVEITGFSFWSGDESLYTVAHNVDNAEFTITHNGTETGDQVGLSVSFKDQSSDGYYSLELISTVVWGAWQQEQIDYLQDLRFQLATTSEYSYVAEFYVDVLENTGALTEEEALNFKREALDNDYNSNAGYEYSALLHSIEVLDLYVKLGWYTEESEVSATKSTISAFLPLVLADKGKGNLAVVNELSAMSSGLLPSMTFESSIDQYNVAEGLYSHFTNNATYGELDSGTWKFNNTYRFLQAVIEKSNAQVEEKYQAQ